MSRNYTWFIKLWERKVGFVCLQKVQLVARAAMLEMAFSIPNSSQLWIQPKTSPLWRCLIENLKPETQMLKNKSHLIVFGIYNSQYIFIKPAPLSLKEGYQNICQAFNQLLWSLFCLVLATPSWQKSPTSLLPIKWIRIHFERHAQVAGRWWQTR